MKLIDPQPMETLPESGEVYVEFSRDGLIVKMKVEDVRMYELERFEGWSYDIDF